MNIFFSDIQKKFVTIDDKTAPWMTEKIKKKIILKNLIHKSYISNGKTTTDYQKLHNIGNEVSQVIRKSPLQKAFTSDLFKKLRNSLANSKPNWPILKQITIVLKFP